MSQDGLKITFTPEQLYGVYDLNTFRAWVHRFSDTTFDYEFVRDWQTMSDGSLSLNSDDVTTVALQEAFAGIAINIDDTISNPVDTSNPGLWAAVVYMLTCTNRLCMYPQFRYRDITVKELFRTLACVLDTVFRAADIQLRDTATPALNFKAQLKRASTLYIDLVCGRGMAWLAYADMMGREASYSSGLLWEESLDVLAIEYVDRYVHTIQTLGFADEADEASMIVGQQATSFAMNFDRFTAERLSYMASGYEEIPLMALTECMHSEIAYKMFDALAPAYPDGPDIAGQAQIYGVPAAAACWLLPRNLLNILRQSYVPVAHTIDDMLRDAWGRKS